MWPALVCLEQHRAATPLACKGNQSLQCVVTALLICFCMRCRSMPLCCALQCFNAVNGSRFDNTTLHKPAGWKPCQDDASKYYASLSAVPGPIGESADVMALCLLQLSFPFTPVLCASRFAAVRFFDLVCSLLASSLHITSLIQTPSSLKHTHTHGVAPTLPTSACFCGCFICRGQHFRRVGAPADLV